MKYLSLFSGIGGFELGIKQAYEELYNIRSNKLADSKGSKKLHSPKNKLKQWKCVGYSEIDKYAIQIYEKHFKHKNYGNIKNIKAENLPDFDLIVGGFPCQSFSIAGKRKGFEDTRGTLFFDIARIIKEKQPRLLLLENVKGLLSHDQGKTFFTIIATLDELGYDCQWQVLNSKDFGVPQNRERVFIVGHLRGTPRPKIFPIGENDQISNGESKSKQRRTQAKYSGTLRGSNIKADNTFIQSNPHGFNKGGKKDIPNVRNSTPHNELVNGIRRLTPKECERLQGFPDDWTASGVIESNPGIDSTIKEIEISDTQRYKTLGNAVTVNVIREIAKRLLV